MFDFIKKAFNKYAATPLEVEYGRMRVIVNEEAGFVHACMGLGLSYGITSIMDGKNVYIDKMDRLENLAKKLSKKDGGHDKFLESMVVWMSINAPREWWAQFDTYRVGTTKQSESTMHTIMKRHLEPTDFMEGVDLQIIQLLNNAIDRKDFFYVKKNLPEGFLQGREVCTNYKVLKNIVQQRMNHRLPEWQYFIVQLENLLQHPEFIFGGNEENKDD